MPAEFRTPSDYLAERQKRHPPIYYRVDGGRSLVEGALSFCPEIIRCKSNSGLIAAGEVGDLTPVASVSERGDGHAIEMHSGLMRLIYSATRALVSTDSGKARGEPGPALTAEQAAEKIAELFTNYQTSGTGTAQWFPITNHQKRWANTITVHAETFLMMHELAHIYNEPKRASGFWSFFRKKRDVYEMEIQADSTAGNWLVEYSLNPVPGSSQPQMFYAGAEFGLRIWTAIEKSKEVRFETTHPSAADRIAALRAKLRSTGGSRAFYAIANTCLAYDQMWRAVEQIILKRPPVFEFTLDDVLSSMRTIVYELLRDRDANGDIPDVFVAQPVPGQPGQFQLILGPTDPQKIAMVKSARDYMSRVDPNLRSTALAHAGDVFEPGTPEYIALRDLLKP